MDRREELKQIEIQIQENEEQQGDLGNKLCALEKKKKDLLIEIIEDEGLLSEYNWIVASEYGDRAVLRAKEKVKHPEINELGSGFYHFTVPLNNVGCTCKVDDGDLTIYLDSGVSISGLVKKYNLTLDTSRMEETIELLKRKLQQAEDVLLLTR